MTALSAFSLSLLTWPFRLSEPKAIKTEQFDATARRQIVNDMIATGACDSEYGVQLLMAAFPDQF